MNVIDVVNFNADASCLSTKKWLSILQGGQDSLLFRLLNLYVTHQKKVVFSFPGATLSDIMSFNPEAIELINRHPDIFEIIYRSYAHGIAILRSDETFLLNLELGCKLIDDCFQHTSPFYLPSEFMLTGSQVKILKEHDFTSTFILASRFKDRYADSIPKIPHMIRGVLGSSLGCIPFYPECTHGFLNSIHHFDTSYWEESIRQGMVGSQNDVVYSWRDGESAFLVDHHVEREEQWLMNESEKIERMHLCEMKHVEFIEAMDEDEPYCYPRHPFAAWMEKLGLLGLIHKIDELESHLSSVNKIQKSLFLQLIGSDILSSVEKDDITIDITNYDDRVLQKFTIKRANKIMEGEDYLYLIEIAESEKLVRDAMRTSNDAHIRVLEQRIEVLNSYLS